MRRTLIFGSLLAVFLMLMLPAVSAAESKVAQSAKTSPYLLDIQETCINTIRAKYADNPSPQTFILLTLAILFLKFLRWGAVFIGGIIILIILKIIRGQNNTASIAC